MAEMNAFERRLEEALLAYADDVPTIVDAAAIAGRVALQHPRRAARVLPGPFAAVPRVAWILLIAAALLALVGSVLFVGTQRRDVRGPVAWERIDPPGPGQISDVVETPDGYLAVGAAYTTHEGEAAAWTSTDCRHWERSGTFDAAPGALLTGVARAGTTYAATGWVPDPTLVVSSEPALWTSSDLRQWARVTPQSDNPGDGNGGAYPADMAVIGDRFVAVGGTQYYGDIGTWLPAIWTSLDGRAWQRATQFDRPLTATEGLPWVPAGALAITEGGPGSVAVGVMGRGGVVWTSSDALSWTQVLGDDEAVGGMLQDVAAGPGGVLVAVGSNGWGTQQTSEDLARPAVWGSADGTTWSPLATALSSQVRGIAGTDRGFVAVDAKEIWTSPDGRTWGREPADPAFDYAELQDVMVCGDLVVVTGSSATPDRGSSTPAAWTLPIDALEVPTPAPPTPTAAPTPTPKPSLLAVEGTDILATRKARPVPLGVGCPPWSDPDQPGPVDQQRPATAGSQFDQAMTFDLRAGRVVLLSSTASAPAGGGSRTWTFDVCTNTWREMRPDAEPPTGLSWLAYDGDSDRTVALVADTGSDSSSDSKLETWVYDLTSNRWSQGKDAPLGDGDRGIGLGFVYDPVSGLLVWRDPWTGGLWAYEVEADTWARVRQGAELPTAWRIQGDQGGKDGVDGIPVLGYDASADLLVLWDGSVDGTWLFDPRNGTWSAVAAGGPGFAPTCWLHCGTYAGHDSAGFDQSVGMPVFVSGEGARIVGYDAAAHQWKTLLTGALSIGPEAEVRCVSDTAVIDPIHERLVCLSGRGEVANEPDGVSAFDLRAWRWTTLLSPTTPEAASPAPSPSS
jgi:hypothetical protein